MEGEKNDNMGGKRRRKKAEQAGVRWGGGGGEWETSLAENQLDIKIVDVIISARRDQTSLYATVYPPTSTPTLCMFVCERMCQCRGWKGSWVKSFLDPSLAFMQLVTYFFHALSVSSFFFFTPLRPLISSAKTTEVKTLSKNVPEFFQMEKMTFE